ncbi:MAG: preprotein translocase subunit SecE [Bacilli bacterium]|nr:preprotein translocase subunit SecE [Bacilli bacterium]
MAEVRKKEKVEKYNIDEIAVKKNKKEEPKKVEKKDKKRNNKKKVKEEKKSLWVRFRIFCHGVKSEFTKIHWPSKKEMVRYSIASIFFIIFCALFFYLINVIFALVQTLFN